MLDNKLKKRHRLLGQSLLTPQRYVYIWYSLLKGGNSFQFARACLDNTCTYIYESRTWQFQWAQQAEDCFRHCLSETWAEHVGTLRIPAQLWVKINIFVWLFALLDGGREGFLSEISKWCLRWCHGAPSPMSKIEEKLEPKLKTSALYFKILTTSIYIYECHAWPK